MAWDRKTPWRQGHVLPDEAAVRLNLAADGIRVAVIISHDCDIAQDEGREAVLEIIVGRFVERPNGNFTHAKNSRTLHLDFSSGAAVVTVELEATKKASVPKNDLEESSPRLDLQLSPAGKSILQRWLAARYRRAAFPDEFESRLHDSGVAEKIKKAVAATGPAVSAIYFDVDEGEDVARTVPEDTYALGIYLLYDTATDAKKAEAMALLACTALKKLFEHAFLGADGKWQQIELLYCDVVSDEALSYRQSTNFKKWNLDYLSLRANPPQPMTTDD